VNGLIRIELSPSGDTRIYLIQPHNETELGRLWSFYCALNSHILELSELAQEKAIISNSSESSSAGPSIH